MPDESSPAVETGSVQRATKDTLPAAVRPSGQIWPGWRASRAWRYALLRRLLACADVVAALVASASLYHAGESAKFTWSLFFLPMWIVAAKLLGLYDRDGRAMRHVTVDETALLALWACVSTAFLGLFLALSPAGHFEGSIALQIGVVAAGLAILLRALARWVWRRVTPPERIALIGAGDHADRLRRKLELFPDMHATIEVERDALYPEGTKDLSWLAEVDRLVFAPASLDDLRIRTAIETARSARLQLTVVPPYREAFNGSVVLSYIAELPVLEYGTHDLSRSTLLLKRGLDVVLSSFALVILMPLFVVIAIAVKLDSPGPVFFTQRRAGAGGRPFRMVKFRSMVSNAEERLPELVSIDALSEPMFKLRKDPRVTRVGHLLRRWSLDELPQLWNVLVGQMSLVGPRPEQLDVVERYRPEHRFRLAVKPGLTGPMQVNGRGQLTFAERLAVERDYIDNVSLGRDLGIIGRTIGTVFGRRGAY